MQQENQLNYMFLDDEPVNYREKIEKYIFNWRWFVLAIILALIAAFLYLRYTPKQYQASTVILIDNGNNSGNGANMAAFKDLGLTADKTPIEDEMIILKSKSLMESVVKNLGLNISYYEVGYLRTFELYKEASPLKVTFFNKNAAFYMLNTSFKINIKSVTKFEMLDSEGNKLSDHVFGDNITSPWGNFTVTPTNIKNNSTNKQVLVQISPLKSIATGFIKRLKIDFVMDDSDILELTLSDKINLKAEVILNSLVENYNKNTVENKSLIAQNTNVFIMKRLETIEQDLSVADKGVKTFKTSNKLTDIATEADLVLNAHTAAEQKIIDLNTQLKLTAYVMDYLSSNPEDLIPANLGLVDASITGNSQRYNELLLERNRILKSSGIINPVIINLNTQIKELRKTVTQSLVNLKSSLTISLNAMKQQETLLNSKIIAVPGQELEFRNIQRQQQIIETLYLYLLQKREENAITLAATMPNAKVIDAAEGSNSAISPNDNVTYLIAIFIGFLVPFIGLYIVFLLDNKIHTAKEVEKIIKAPFLGDLPHTKQDKKVVVSDSKRNNEAEAFRLLRTNINFMLANVKEPCKTIYVTSTVPNEGKTFISINLAAVFALSNKKILLIGGDLRKPKLAEYLNITNDNGLTDFLIDPKMTASTIIETIQEHNFDVITTGNVPPNPAELLMNGRFEELISYAKTKYDYIIVDTAPVSLVSDTLLLSVKADLFLYVIRANHIDKRLLEIPKKLLKENKLTNMSVVLNDSDLKKGYGYGYGYGYGEKKASWWKKFKI